MLKIEYHPANKKVIKINSILGAIRFHFDHCMFLDYNKNDNHVIYSADLNTDLSQNHFPCMLLQSNKFLPPGEQKGDFKN